MCKNRLPRSAGGTYRASMSASADYVSHLRIADPDGLVGAIRGSELEPWLLGGHRGESELSRIMLPESCLDHAEIGPAMWFRGAMPTDCYTMVYVTACPEEGNSFTTRRRALCRVPRNSPHGRGGAG
jgi:hypothetical protein